MEYKHWHHTEILENEKIIIRTWKLREQYKTNEALEDSDTALIANGLALLANKLEERNKTLNEEILATEIRQRENAERSKQ